MPRGSALQILSRLSTTCCLSSQGCYRPTLLTLANMLPSDAQKGSRPASAIRRPIGCCELSDVGCHLAWTSDNSPDLGSKRSSRTFRSFLAVHASFLSKVKTSPTSNPLRGAGSSALLHTHMLDIHQMSQAHVFGTNCSRTEANTGNAIGPKHVWTVRKTGPACYCSLAADGQHPDLKLLPYLGDQ